MIFNRTKWLKIRLWELKFWQLSMFFLNPLITFPYYCSICVRHWTQGALIMSIFMKPFLKRQTFYFNQSSGVGIIIINNNNMEQSRISLLFNYSIFYCCYLHGIGRFIVVAMELCLRPRCLSTESLGPCYLHGMGDHDQILQHGHSTCILLSQRWYLLSFKSYNHLNMCIGIIGIT